MDEDELPSLTGHPVLDPWRLRHRQELAGLLPDRPDMPPERTRSEAALWQVLQREPQQWIREYATGRYRLDFYCPAAQLAVEVDGGSHAGQAAWNHDVERDAHHLSIGITTKRFSADLVERDRAEVLVQIRHLVGHALNVAEQPAAVGQTASPEPRPAEGRASSARRKRRRSVRTSPAATRGPRPVGRALARLVVLGPRVVLLLLLAAYVFDIGGTRQPLIDGYTTLTTRVAQHFAEMFIPQTPAPTRAAPVSGG